MNTASKLLSGFALAIIAAAGVHAETYDGVLKVTSTQSRAAVRAEGVAAARSGEPTAMRPGKASRPSPVRSTALQCVRKASPPPAARTRTRKATARA